MDRTTTHRAEAADWPVLLRPQCFIYGNYLFIIYLFIYLLPPGVCVELTRRYSSDRVLESHISAAFFHFFSPPTVCKVRRKQDGGSATGKSPIRASSSFSLKPVLFFWIKYSKTGVLKDCTSPRWRSRSRAAVWGRGHVIQSHDTEGQEVGQSGGPFSPPGRRVHGRGGRLLTGDDG